MPSLATASGKAWPLWKEASLESHKMQFFLRGFSERDGFRVYTFEGVASDKTRALFTVRADLALARKYGIRLQELPLLCRRVLDDRDDHAGIHAFAYSEAAMREFAALAAARAQAAKTRKPPRRPVSDRVGAAWRGPQH